MFTNLHPFLEKLDRRSGEIHEEEIALCYCRQRKLGNVSIAAF